MVTEGIKFSLFVEIQRPLGKTFRNNKWNVKQSEKGLFVSTRSGHKKKYTFHW